MAMRYTAKVERKVEVSETTSGGSLLGLSSYARLVTLRQDDHSSAVSNRIHGICTRSKARECKRMHHADDDGSRWRPPPNEYLRHRCSGTDKRQHCSCCK